MALGACGDDDSGAPATPAAGTSSEVAGHGGEDSTTDVDTAGHSRDTNTDSGANASGRSKNEIADADSAPAEVVVERVLIDHYADPTCQELTAAAQKQFGYGPGPDCDQSIAEQNPPKDVTVSDVKVDGNQATAVANGFTFKFVMRDGLWLIDGTI